MNTIDILKGFTATKEESLREDEDFLREPFLYNGYTYASTYYMIIRIKGEHTHLKFPDNKDSSILEKMFKKQTEENISFSDNILKEYIENLQKHNIEIYEDCETCGGHGIVDWEFESWVKELNCPVCDGHGEDHSKKPTIEKDFYHQYFEIEPDKYIKTEFLEKIASLSDSITFYCDKNNQYFFTAGGFEGCVMGVIPDNLADPMLKEITVANSVLKVLSRTKILP